MPPPTEVFQQLRRCTFDHPRLLWRGWALLEFHKKVTLVATLFHCLPTCPNNNFKGTIPCKPGTRVDTCNLEGLSPHDPADYAQMKVTTVKVKAAELLMPPPWRWHKTKMGAMQSPKAELQVIERQYFCQGNPNDTWQQSAETNAGSGE